MGVTATISGMNSHCLDYLTHLNSTLSALTNAIFLAMRQDGVPCEKVKIWSLTQVVRRQLAGLRGSGGPSDFEEGLVDPATSPEQRQLSTFVVLAYFTVFTNDQTWTLGALQSGVSAALSSHLVETLRSLRDPWVKTATDVEVQTIVTPTHAPTLNPTNTLAPTYAPPPQSPLILPAAVAGIVLISVGYVLYVYWVAIKECLCPKKVVPLTPEEEEAAAELRKHVMAAALNPWKHMRLEPELAYRLQEWPPRPRPEAEADGSGSPRKVVPTDEDEDECKDEEELALAAPSPKRKKAAAGVDDEAKDEEGGDDDLASPKTKIKAKAKAKRNGAGDGEEKGGQSPGPSLGSPSSPTGGLPEDYPELPPLPSDGPPPPVELVWVVKVHPQRRAAYYKHPATGKVTWKAPDPDGGFFLMSNRDYKRLYLKAEADSGSAAVAAPETGTQETQETQASVGGEPGAALTIN